MMFICMGEIGSHDIGDKAAFTSAKCCWGNRQFTKLNDTQHRGHTATLNRAFFNDISSATFYILTDMLSVVTLSGIMLSGIMIRGIVQSIVQSGIMLSGMMLSGIMLSVIIISGIMFSGMFSGIILRDIAEWH
jgi:hypothetical protein